MRLARAARMALAQPAIGAHDPRWPAHCRITGRQVVRGMMLLDNRSPGIVVLRRKGRNSPTLEVLSHGDRVRVGGRRWGLRPPASGATAEVSCGVCGGLSTGHPSSRPGHSPQVHYPYRRPPAEVFGRLSARGRSAFHARLIAHSSGLTGVSADQPLPVTASVTMICRCSSCPKPEAAAILHRIRAARRVVGRDRVAAPVPRYHGQLQARECARVIAGWKPLPPRPAQAASAPGALRRSHEMSDFRSTLLAVPARHAARRSRPLLSASPCGQLSSGFSPAGLS